MKKLLIVTIALTLGVFLASSSFAGIAGSKHDLSSTGINGNVDATNALRVSNNEICVYCHTPHNANDAVSDAPLWNKDLTTQTFTPYDSTTLDATMGTGGDEVTGVSLLCLSCHDGVTALDAYGATTRDVFQGNGNDVLGSAAGDVDWSGSLANLGTDLARTHPVSFVYQSAITNGDLGLNARADGNAVDNLLFGGTGDRKVECASCHDVHDDTNAPFLVMSNASSTLCLVCHNK